MRGDLADVALAGTLFAPHYAEAVACAVATPAAMVRAAPDAMAAAVSQLLLGERFDLLDLAGDWAWGRCGHDGYVGYVRRKALGIPATPATHRIATIAAPLFAAPSIKAAVLATWPIGARFAAERDGAFLATAAGHIHVVHAAPVDAVEADWVTIAERFVGQAYFWGGRGAGGIDCSGLVQVALACAGIAAPRDSDMQQAGIGTAIDPGDALRRGDLVFFPGHVGLMVDDERIIHANAHAMAVTIEPLVAVVARLAATHDAPILARRRP